MKNILLTLTAATLLFTACKTEKKSTLDTDKQIVFTDTSLLNPTNISTDVATGGNATPAVAPVAAPKPEIRTVTKIIRIKEKQPKPRVNTPPVVAPTAPVADVPAPVGTGTTGSAGTGTTGGATPAETQKKKGGWSDAAKGATIGGVGGAVAGAVIGKGAKGAVIGGIIGAAGGYILGRNKDKKAARTDTIKY